MTNELCKAVATKTAGYTPGPWTADIRGGCAVVYQGEDCGGCIENGRKRLAYFHGYKDSKDGWQVILEDKANARLIAAAPDLLEAAKTFLSYGRKCPPGCPCGYDDAEKNLRAAIRKATGEA